MKSLTASLMLAAADWASLAEWMDSLPEWGKTILGLVLIAVVTYGAIWLWAQSWGG